MATEKIPSNLDQTTLREAAANELRRQFPDFAKHFIALWTSPRQLNIHAAYLLAREDCNAVCADVPSLRLVYRILRARFPKVAKSHANCISKPEPINELLTNFVLRKSQEVTIGSLRLLPTGPDLADVRIIVYGDDSVIPFLQAWLDSEREALRFLPHFLRLAIRVFPQPLTCDNLCLLEEWAAVALGQPHDARVSADQLRYFSSQSQPNQSEPASAPGSVSSDPALDRFVSACPGSGSTPSSTRENTGVAHTDPIPSRRSGSANRNTDHRGSIVSSSSAHRPRRPSPLDVFAPAHSRNTGLKDQSAAKKVSPGSAHPAAAAKVVSRPSPHSRPASQSTQGN